LLEANRNDRGIANWIKHDPSDGKWSSYGIGLTQLRKFAKRIGKNHELALELWEEPNIECRQLSPLVDDPNSITREQVDRQVSGLGFWMLSHVYCGAVFGNLPFSRELAEEWFESEDDIRRRCAFAILGGLTKKKDLDDSYFEPHIDIIQSRLRVEENFVKDAMNNALLAIGTRSSGLHKKALSAAKKIGRVEVDYGDNSCQALDVVKHLQSPRIKQKLKA